ncbi:MAG: AraC family transcriptional regulator ligand-binding domain-containing protein [Polyangiales bacterium]
MGSSTVLAALTRSVIDAAAALGLDRVALLRAGGLDEAALADPDARVPIEQHLAVWTAVAERPVGLALGARLGLDGLGVLGYAMRHGATVGEALACLARCRAVVHEGAVPAVALREVEGAQHLVLTQIVPPPFARLREPVDAQAAGAVAALRWITGRAVDPLAVALSRPRPVDTRRHEAYFRCPVAWAAPAIEVTFDAAVLAWPLPRSDEALFGYLARRVDALLTELPAARSFAERTRHAVVESLRDGEPRLDDVARRLAVSGRTLHRRLGEEGTGFARLVDDVRRARAHALLEDARLSAAEVAFVLGYAEAGAFFRAFRRWTGTTPQAWRAGTATRRRTASRQANVRPPLLGQPVPRGGAAPTRDPCDLVVAPRIPSRNARLGRVARFHGASMGVAFVPGAPRTPAASSQLRRDRGRSSQEVRACRNRLGCRGIGDATARAGGLRVGRVTRRVRGRLMNAPPPRRSMVRLGPRAPARRGRRTTGPGGAPRPRCRPDSC